MYKFMNHEVNFVRGRLSRIRLGCFALGGAGLVLAGGLVLHYSVGWKGSHVHGERADSAPAVSRTNAVTEIGRSALGTPGRPDTEASRVLRLAQDWQRKNPAYHVRVETTSLGWFSVAEVYRFANEKGELVSRASSQISQPVSAKLVIEAEPARVVIFFPRMNQALEFDTEQDLRKILGAAGVITGSQGTGLPMAKARSCFVETGQNFKALTMMFSGQDFGLAESAGALFLTIKLDEAGRPFEVEELTLGRRVTSKLTYLSFDQAVVSQEAPVIGAKAQRASRPLQEILQEELNEAKPAGNKPFNKI